MTLPAQLHFGEATCFNFLTNNEYNRFFILYFVPISVFRNDGKQQNLPLSSMLLFTVLFIYTSPFSSFNSQLSFLFPYLLLFLFYSSSSSSPPQHLSFNTFSHPKWKNTQKILKEGHRMEAAGNEGAEIKRKLLLMKWCGIVSKRGKKW